MSELNTKPEKHDTVRVVKSMRTADGEYLEIVAQPYGEDSVLLHLGGHLTLSGGDGIPSALVLQDFMALLDVATEAHSVVARMMKDRAGEPKPKC